MKRIDIFGRFPYNIFIRILILILFLFSSSFAQSLLPGKGVKGTMSKGISSSSIVAPTPAELKIIGKTLKYNQTKKVHQDKLQAMVKLGAKAYIQSLDDLACSHKRAGSNALFGIGDISKFYGIVGGPNNHYVYLSNWYQTKPLSTPCYIAGYYHFSPDIGSRYTGPGANQNTFWHEVNHALLEQAKINVACNGKYAGFEKYLDGAKESKDDEGHHLLIEGVGQRGKIAYEHLYKFEKALKEAALVEFSSQNLSQEDLASIYSDAKMQFEVFRKLWSYVAPLDKTDLASYKIATGIFFSAPDKVENFYKKGALSVNVSGKVKKIYPPDSVFKSIYFDNVFPAFINVKNKKKSDIFNMKYCKIEREFVNMKKNVKSEIGSIPNNRIISEGNVRIELLKPSGYDSGAKQPNISIINKKGVLAPSCKNINLDSIESYCYKIEKFSQKNYTDLILKIPGEECKPGKIYKVRITCVDDNKTKDKKFMKGEKIVLFQIPYKMSVKIKGNSKVFSGQQVTLHADLKSEASFIPELEITWINETNNSIIGFGKSISFSINKTGNYKIKAEIKSGLEVDKKKTLCYDTHIVTVRDKIKSKGNEKAKVTKNKPGKKITKNIDDKTEQTKPKLPSVTPKNDKKSLKTEERDKNDTTKNENQDSSVKSTQSAKTSTGAKSPPSSNKPLSFSGSTPNIWQGGNDDKGFFFKRKEATATFIDVKEDKKYSASVSGEIWGKFNDSFAPSSKDELLKELNERAKDTKSRFNRRTGIYEAKAKVRSITIDDFSGYLLESEVYGGGGWWTWSSSANAGSTAWAEGWVFKENKTIHIKYRISGGGPTNSSLNSFLLSQTKAGQSEAKGILAGLHLVNNGKFSSTPYDGPKLDGSDMLKASLTAFPEEPSFLGDTVEVTAKINGGKPPYSYVWSGDHGGKGAKVLFGSRKEGDHKLSVTVTDAREDTVTAEITIKVEALDVTVNQISPSVGSHIFLGSPVAFEAKIKGSKNNKLEILWQPHPEVSFDPYEKSFNTKATFPTIGTYKVWAQVYLREGENRSLVGESEQLAIEVVFPKITLIPDNKTPFVGEKVTIKVREDPKVKDDLIAFWWEIKGGKTINAGSEANVLNNRVYSFIPKDTEQITVTVHAKAKDGGADLGEASILINAKAYSVVPSKPKRLDKAPWTWDPKQGKAVELPQAIAVFQNAEVHATVTPKPKEKLRYQWTVSPEGCSISAPMSQSTNLNAHEKRTYQVTVKVSDKNGIELGEGSTSYTVTVSQRDLDVAKQKAEDQQKAKELLQEGRKDWKEGKLEQAISKVVQAQRVVGKEKEISKTLNAMHKQKKEIDDKLAKASDLIMKDKFDDTKKVLSSAANISDKYEKYKKVLKQLTDAKKKAEENKQRMAKLLKDAKVLKDAGKLDEASILLKNGNKQFPANKEIDKLLKDVLQQQEDARKKMTEGQAEWKKGMLDKAVSTLKEAVKIDLSNKQIAKVLKGMQGQKKMMDDALKKADKLIEQKKFDQVKSVLKKAGRVSSKYPPYVEMLKKLDIAKKRVEEEKIAAEKQRQDRLKKESEEALTKKKAEQEEAGRRKEQERVEAKRLQEEKNAQEAAEKVSQQPTSQDLAYAKSFAGKWNSTYGVMELKVQGLRVSGNYAHDKGRIDAVLSQDAKTMKGTWAEAPSYKGSRDAGKMYFKLSSDGKKIDGLWSYGDAVPTSRWTATRIIDTQPQTPAIIEQKLPKEIKPASKKPTGNIASLAGSWSFGRSKHYGKTVHEHLCDLVLTDHLVAGKGYKIKSCHPNESYWILEGKILLFIALDGTVTTRFTEVKPNYWEGTYVGSAHSTEGVVHYLKKSDEGVNTTKRSGTHNIVGKTKTSTSYAPNNKGDVFKGGHWAGASGRSDWLQKDFSSPQLVTGVYIGRASTDITTKGFRLVLKLKKTNGQWITIDELHDTNINRTVLSGGAKGQSIPSYTKKLSTVIKATAFRLEFYGHGWFDATDIRIYFKDMNKDEAIKKAALKKRINDIRNAAAKNQVAVQKAKLAKQIRDIKKAAEERAKNNTLSEMKIGNINGVADVDNEDTISGIWRRSDGNIVRFQKENNNIYVGYIEDVGPLASYHFKNGEILFKSIIYLGHGKYKGKSKGRNKNGKLRWTDSTIMTITGDTMRNEVGGIWVRTNGGSKDALSKFAGTLEGAWSGKGTGDWKGWTSNGTFTMNISESGKISGTYVGDDQGKLSGSVSDSGKLDIKSGGGSAGSGKWNGTIKTNSQDKLQGSGTWSVDGFNGTWYGSEK